MRVDCYAESRNGSSGINAQIRAHNLEMLTRSSVACDFFKPYGIYPLYADSPQDTTVISDSNNYLHRWTVNLHLNLTNSFKVFQEGFEEVKPVYLNSYDKTGEKSGFHVSNVDVKFKIKK